MPRIPRLNGTTLALVAVFAALIAASTIWGGYPLGSGVPITLQTFAVVLTGLALGAYRGAAAVALYVVLGSIGLPIFAKHATGATVWPGPTAGFLVGFVVAAFVAGWAAERVARSPRATFAGFLGAGTLTIPVIYAIGLPVMAARLHIPLFANPAGCDAVSLDWASGCVNATTGGLIGFLPGDLLKVILAAIVATAIFAAYPHILAGEPNAATASPEELSARPVARAKAGASKK